MFTKLGTRGRVVLTSIIMGLILLFISSPIASNTYELLFPPSKVSNVKVTEKDKEIDLSWDKNPEEDVVGYLITLDATKVNLDKETKNYSFYQLENDKAYELEVVAVDSADKVSSPLQVQVTPRSKAQTQTYNKNEESNNARNIIITSIIFSLILFLFNLWVLFFKVNKSTIFTIAAFPSFCTIPFLIFSLALISSINTFTNKLILSFGVVVMFVIGNYLLLLTSNILNGSIYNDIPLVQAGKASQFIFSLISTYLILIYAFGSYQDFVIRVIISLPFVYYFSYSSIWMNKNILSQQVFIRAISITLIMFLTLTVLSIWPIESVYAILSASVIFYILLNIALEVRKTLNRAVWVEYGVLTLLILILLFTNGVWGINGTII